MKRILCIILSAVLVLGASSCTGKKSENTYNLYFLDSTSSSISIEKRTVNLTDEEQTDNTKFVERLVGELLKGPEDTIDFIRAIPQEAKLLSVSVSDSPVVSNVASPLATINFSSAFRTEDAYAMNLAVYSIIHTLCETERIASVCIQVNGINLFGEDKFPMGAISLTDYSGENDKTVQTADIILYLPTNDGKLVKTAKTVENHTNEPIPSLTLNQLVSELSTVGMFPSDAKVVSTETRDGIFYINLSSNFFTKATGQSYSDIMLINSIILTMTELPDINKVQFLSDGVKIETFGQMDGFDSPMERDESLLSQ